MTRRRPSAPQQRLAHGPVQAGSHVGSGFQITGVYDIDPYIYWGLGTVLLDEPGGLFWSVGPRLTSLGVGVPTDLGATLWRIVDEVPTPIASHPSGISTPQPERARADFLGEGRTEVVFYAFVQDAHTSPATVRFVNFVPGGFIFFPTVFRVAGLSVSGETISAGPMVEHQVLTSDDPPGHFVPDLFGGAFALDMPGTFANISDADVAGLGSGLSLLIFLADDETLPETDPNSQMLCVFPFDPFGPVFPTFPRQTPTWPVKHSLAPLGITETRRAGNLQVVRRTAGEAVVLVDVEDDVYLFRIGPGGEVLSSGQVDTGHSRYGLAYVGQAIAIAIGASSQPMRRIDGATALASWSQPVDGQVNGLATRYEDTLYSFARFLDDDDLEVQDRTVDDDEASDSWSMDLAVQPELGSIAAAMAVGGGLYAQVDESCWVVQRIEAGRNQIVQVCAGGQGPSDHLGGTDRFRRLPRGLTNV